MFLVKAFVPAGIFVTHLFLVQTAVVAIPAITFDESTGGAGLHTDSTVGWQFHVVKDIAVTGLGWYDENADGLNVSHRVGIWDAAGALLAEVTVPSGTGAPLDGQFRTVFISPIKLQAADNYTIGGLLYQSDPERLVCGNDNQQGPSVCAPVLQQNVDPRITYSAAVYSPASTDLTRPVLIGVSTQGYYGPSFSVQAVPEPALAWMGLWLLVGSAFIRAERKAIRERLA